MKHEARVFRICSQNKVPNRERTKVYEKPVPASGNYHRLNARVL